MKKRLLAILADHVLIFIAFFAVSAMLGYSAERILGVFKYLLFGFMGLHLFVAMLFDKYNFGRRSGGRKTLYPLLYTNLTFVLAGSLIIMLRAELGGYHMLFYGTAAMATVFELLGWWVLYVFYAAKHRGYAREHENGEGVSDEEKKGRHVLRVSPPRVFASIHGMAIRQSILDQIGPGAFDYLRTHVPLGKSSMVISSADRLSVLILPKRGINTIVNLQRVNDHQFVNKFFESVNYKLPQGGIFSSYAETKELRKARFLRRYTPFLGFVLYSFDFLWTRLAPKLPVFKKIYFRVTQGRNRVMSRAEILGRLYSCGFEILDETQVNGVLFFVARKIREPYFDNNPTYGPLICLRRVGKNGTIIGVYKMRTMHPYAEYLQPYIYKLNRLQENGKFNNDFRISTIGRIMRKLWIDELPMLINWVKGDLKLVGVRPLSQHYFKLYDPVLQTKRIKVKPGLIPPFYADMPKTLEEIMESENRYIDAYLKRSYRTDWSYFWKAFHNIVFCSARSS